MKISPRIQIVVSTAAVVLARTGTATVSTGFNEFIASYDAKVMSDYRGPWRRFDEVNSENRGWPHTRPLSFFLLLRIQHRLLSLR